MSLVSQITSLVTRLATEFNSVRSEVTSALSDKQDVVSGVSSTEIGYLDGVTSAIQTQLDAKSPLAGSSSITTVGTVTNVTSPTATDSSGLRKTYISTSNPSGGSSGDVWLKYTA